MSPVVFVTVALGHQRLRAARAAGALRAARAASCAFPYHPHVTVAHDLADDVLERAFDELADYDVRFPVWGFSLYEHGADGVWRPQRDFPLGQQLPGPRSEYGPAGRGHRRTMTILDRARGRLARRPTRSGPGARPRVRA